MLEQKVVELLEKIDKVVERYAPETVDAVVRSVQISALGELVGGVVSLGLGVVAGIATYRIVRFLLRKAEEEYGDWEMGALLTGFAGASVTIILCIVAFSALCDVWIWVGLFNPKLALVHKIIGM